MREIQGLLSPGAQRQRIDPVMAVEGSLALRGGASRIAAAVVLHRSRRRSTLRRGGGAGADACGILAQRMTMWRFEIAAGAGGAGGSAADLAAPPPPPPHTHILKKKAAAAWASRRPHFPGRYFLEAQQLGARQELVLAEYSAIHDLAELPRPHCGDDAPGLPGTFHFPISAATRSTCPGALTRRASRSTRQSMHEAGAARALEEGRGCGRWGTR